MTEQEQIILHNVQGIARKSGIDQYGCQWTEFEVDYFAEQLLGTCCFCLAEINEGWLCLDGGEECCDKHVSFAEPIHRDIW